MWRPRCKDATSVAPSVHGHESQTLRVVRKLHNQLGQLCAQSHDHPLRRNVGVSLRNLRHLLPETPYFCLDCPEAAFQWCDQLHRELQAQEKQAALARWRQRLKEDSVAAAAWVKRKAAEFLQGAGAQVLPPEECQTVHSAAFVKRAPGLPNGPLPGMNSTMRQSRPPCACCRTFLRRRPCPCSLMRTCFRRLQAP